jgi:hypothetical protein
MWRSMRPTLKRTLTPGESANIAKSEISPLRPRSENSAAADHRRQPDISRAKEFLSTASAILATQGLNEQISREKGVKELLVERTISIRRHATATLTRLENK